MSIDDIHKLAQACVQHHPVVVLGSGASVPHNIRGMSALADVLKKYLTLEGREENEAWTKIVNDLDSGFGLEEALQKTAAPKSLIKKIVDMTWLTVATDDLALLQRAAKGMEVFPLSILICHLFKSTNKIINIVTPNYDRVAEFSADIAGYVHTTGFVPGFIRRREGAEPIIFQKGKHPARAVRIWKVHGSIDWFADEQRQIVSLPPCNALPEGFSPLIVTPGISKYERTHDEPYRSAIQGADKALLGANAVLCIGYGFRDWHIEPKLVERCRQKNLPLVILARTLTEEAKRFLRTDAGTAYLAMEDSTEGTRVFTHAVPDGAVIQDRKLWSFADFIDLAL